MLSPRQQLTARNLLVACLYYATGVFGELLSSGPSGPSLVFPPAGVALGAVMLWGARVWPGILLGTLFMAWSLEYPAKVFFVPLLACPFVAVFVPYFLRRVSNFRSRLESHQDVFLLGLAALLAGALSAVLSVPLLTYFGVSGLTWEHLPSKLGTWCLGDATGVILIAPLFLALREAHGNYLRQDRQGELCWAFSALIAVSGIVFWGWLEEGPRAIALLIAPYPFIIWIGMRFERLAVTVSSLILSVMAISGTAHGHGPYVQEGLRGNLIMLSGLLATSSITVLLLNVTLLAHHRTEAMLARQSSLLRNILSHLPGAVYWKDQHGVFQGGNLEFTQLANFSDSAEMIGKTNANLPPSLVKEGLNGNRDLHVLRTGEPLLGMEFTESTRADSPRSFLINKVPLRDIEGNITGLVGTVLDITAIKQADRVVQDSLRRLHRIVDHLPAGAVYVENEQLHFNNAVEAITGYAEGELTTRDQWFAALYPETPHIRKDYERARSQGFPRSRELVITRKDGEKRWLVISCYVDEQGEIWLLHDATDQHRAQESLRERELELIHISRLSSLGEMVAELAHEINQPLYSIVNFSQACLNTLEDQNFEGAEVLRDWLEKIHGQADQAGKIIRRLRHLTAPTPPQIEEVKVAEALEEVLELFQADANKLKIRLHREFPEATPTAWADRVQLQQILINLIKNAHESLASISEQRVLTTRLLPRPDQLEVVVADNGPGFSEEAARKMFDNYFTTKSRGMGMGLPICRSLAMAQGGNLWLEPAQPRGAEIHFTLPNTPPPEQDPFYSTLPPHFREK